jgi:hypothetical protein
MKNAFVRKTILIFAVIILAVIYAVQLATEKRTKAKTIFVEKEIGFVSVQKSGEEIFSIRKDGDEWTANGGKIPVAENKANGIVNSINEIKILDAWKISGDDEERYGLGEQNCIVVEARQKEGGEILRTLKIGKTTSTGGQCYIQVDGGKSVCLAQGLFRSTFDVSAEDIKKSAE